MLPAISHNVFKLENNVSSNWKVILMTTGIAPAHIYINTESELVCPFSMSDMVARENMSLSIFLSSNSYKRFHWKCVPWKSDRNHKSAFSWLINWSFSPPKITKYVFVDTKSILVQIMVWCNVATSQYRTSIDPDLCHRRQGQSQNLDTLFNNALNGKSSEAE